MKDPKFVKLKRDLNWLERPLTWWGIVIVLGGGGGWLAWDRFTQLIGAADSATTMFTVVAGLGGLVLLLSGVAYGYSFRKRHTEFYKLQGPAARRIGSMLVWFKSHTYLGLLAFGLAVLHAVLATFTTEPGSTGKIVLGLFALLVGSGFIWRLVLKFAPAVIAREVHNLAVEDTRAKRLKIRGEIAKLLAGKSERFNQAYAQVERGLAPAVHGLSAEEQKAWQRYLALAGRITIYNRREQRQIFWARLLTIGKWVHWPLAGLFVFGLVWHLFDVFKVSNPLVTDPVQHLPSAAQCQTCHPALVEEWHQSMHAEAQTGPVVVAQTRLAIERNAQQPLETQLVCNNCHAPAGMTLVKTSPTLPLDPAGELAGHPNSAVVHEGITCIVCHTQAKPLAEGRGGQAAFPIAPSSALFYADFFGPLTSTVPHPAHNMATGFMTDSVSTSNLCGSCHNVKLDMDGDGLVNALVRAKDPEQDDLDGRSENDGQLNQNELDFKVDAQNNLVKNAANQFILEDLVLQTTFDEWQDYVAQEQRLKKKNILGCVDCHMPEVKRATTYAEPGNLFAPIERKAHSHVFVGVDYNLAPTVPAEQREAILQRRELLLRSAASLEVTTTINAAGRLVAFVTVNSTLPAHNMPTGFAFARQMWLEVAAQTTSGQAICLAADPHGLAAPCASGQVQATEDLPTCETASLRRFDPTLRNANVTVTLAFAQPINQCDPWLTNFQKILTDGDPKNRDVFQEVPYQTFLPDIVKLRVRVADQQTLDALNLTHADAPDSLTFQYEFDVDALQGEQALVQVKLNFRHLPPYFLKALDGFYPDELTSADLLKNLQITEMDSTSSTPITLP